MVIGMIGAIVAATIAVISVVYAYGKLNSRVEAIEKGLVEKLDKALFLVFSTQVEANQKRNTAEHDSINNKLDSIKDLLIRGK